MISKDINNFINDLPNLTWIKDVNFRYIASSKRLIRLLGCASNQDLFDRDDYNQPWSNFADIYRKEDEKVLKGDSFAFLHPIKLFTGEEVLVITRKTPLMNTLNNVVGISGHITIANSPRLVKNISEIKKIDFEIAALSCFEPGRYHIADYFTDLPLTKRECACLFYLVRGKTAQDIANLLFISKRTVEKHIISIKTKLKCQSKSEIIDRALELGFISFIPNAFLISQA